jgi:protein-L-isoaspartate(D-aspartate) O-methyltransferase
MQSEIKLQTARLQMVQEQLRSRGITHPAVLEAFMSVPREQFVPPQHQHQAYEDQPLPIGLGQTISQPYIVALMLQELDPRPHHRVLEIGAGSGYQTALLARLVQHVYAVERLNELTEQAMGALARLGVNNVTLCTRDGSLGWSEEAPFDRIICGAASPETPPLWTDQLTDGGRIVVPLGGPDFQTLTVVTKTPRGLVHLPVTQVRFVRLIGKAGWPGE